MTNQVLKEVPLIRSGIKRCP